MAGATGKPPPRLRRGETLTCGGFAATLASFRRKRGTIRGSEWGKIYSPAVITYTPQKDLSSVSLTADSFLCGGSLLAAPLAKPPLKGEVPAHGGRRGSSPHAAKVAAALSAAVTTTQQQEKSPPLRRNQLRRKAPRQTPAALREKGSGEEGLLSEKPPPPQNPPSPRTSLEEGARGRGLFFRKGPSLASPLNLTHSRTRRCGLDPRGCCPC